MSNDIRTFKIENLIKETVTLALFEQEQGMAGNVAPPPPPINGNPVPPSAPMPPDNQLAPPPQQSQPANAQAVELTLDSMIERLNVIRGGKSFSDPEIYGQLTSYFKTLSPQDKTMLDSFLQNVSKIMVNVRSGVEEEPVSGQEQQMQQNINNSGMQAPIAPVTQPPATQQAAPQVNVGMPTM